jgi:hypothetical protein
MMGVDYSAVLGFGYPINDTEWTPPWMEDPFHGDEQGWWLAQHEVPYDTAYNEEGEQHAIEGEVYWEARKQRLKENPLPVDFMEVGWDEEPMVVVCVKGTKAHVWSHKAKKLDVREMDMDAELLDLGPVEDFCREYNFPVDFEPGWYIGVHIS